MVDAVRIVEVAPRDGLQNESKILDTGTKVELVHRLMAAGATRIEAVSFVHPKHVPAMADAEDVMSSLDRRPEVSLAGLVVNQRGFDRAVEAAVDEVNYVVVATETFNRRNQGASIDESVEVWELMGPQLAAEGLFRTVTIGAAFGCPFEGEVSVDRVVQLAERIAAVGVDELALADTIGVGAPPDVIAKVEAVRHVAPGVKLRCHLHNTRNTGLANAYAAVQAGIEALDSSLGGIGGCPFAPDATGNIATEDLAYLLQRMDVRTDLDLAGMLPDAVWLGEQLGKPVPGLLSRAGLFPDGACVAA